MKIIRAQVKHANKVAPLFDAYRKFYKAKSDTRGALRFIRARLSKDESVIFLAIDGEDSLGFVQLYPVFTSVGMRSLWLLNDLYMVPSARKHGVGKALLKRAEDFARKTKSRGLFLHTAVDNCPAQRLYERCGWVKNKEFIRYDRVIE